MEKLLQIRNERASQYGSFKDNMLLINFIESYFIDDLLQNKNIMDYGEILAKQPEGNLIDSTLKFTYKMLSLKAIRSLNARGDVYDDCILDFLNYKYLAEQVIFEIKGLNINEPIFNFSPLIFNERLNYKEPQNIKWLLKAKELYYYYNLFAKKYKYNFLKFSQFLKEE